MLFFRMRGWSLCAARCSAFTTKATSHRWTIDPFRMECGKSMEFVHHLSQLLRIRSVTLFLGTLQELPVWGQYPRSFQLPYPPPLVSLGHWKPGGAGTRRRMRTMMTWSSRIPRSMYIIPFVVLPQPHFMGTYGGDWGLDLGSCIDRVDTLGIQSYLLRR